MLRAQMSGLEPAKSEILYSAQAGPERSSMRRSFAASVRTAALRSKDDFAGLRGISAVRLRTAHFGRT